MRKRVLGTWWGVCLFLLAPLVAMATGVWHYKDLGNRLISGDLYVGSDLTVADDLTITGDTLYTLGAAEKVQVDASTTAQTQTAGALDLDFASITADANALELAATVNNGASAGVNVYASAWTLTCNDADADMFGLSMTAAATANAAAGSYEYGYSYDCAENTAGACLDGVLITATGTNTGLTDGVDVSDANIANAVNIGVNPIAGGNSDSFTCGATDATFMVTRNDAGVVTYSGADNASPGDVTYDCTGACAIIAGSADVTAFTVTTDGTTDGDVVLPLTSIGAGEIVADTIDGPQLADTLALDASLTITGSAAEQVIVNRTFTDAVTESGQQVNCTTSDTTSGTLNQFCLELDNRASTEAADAMLTIDNSDTDDVVADGIRFIDAGGGFTDYLDAPNLRIVGATGLITWLPSSSNDSLSVSADDTFTFDRDDSGSVTLTCADDDANATLIVAGGGTGTTQVGQATNTSITLSTDGTGDAEVVLPLLSVSGGELSNDTVDGTELADNIAMDTTLSFTGTAGESVTFVRSFTDATAENAVSVNVTALDTTSGTTAQYGLVVTNSASTEALDGLLVVDNSDADDNAAAGLLFLNSSRFTNLISATNMTVTTGGVLTLANSNSLAFTADGTATFDRSATGIYTLTCTDDDATCSITLAPGGAGAVVVGSAQTTTINLTTDGSGDAEVVFSGESVGAAEIVNPSRSVSLPLRSFIDCQTDAGADLTFGADGGNTLPNFMNSATDGTGFTITFDDTGGQEDQSAEICSQLQVPVDYASGGAFVVRASKDAHTAATEVVSCQVSVNGAALEAAGTVTTSASASTSYACTPTIAALAAGDSLGVTLYITSDGTMNDTVNMTAVEFRYTATQ